MATSACLQRVRSLTGRPGPEQISLTIKAVPADTDESAPDIAQLLKDNLEAAGIRADVVLRPEGELRRDVLTRGDFDIYVGRCPTQPDPDYLRPLLASKFKGEPGWQNPFGLTTLGLDEVLDDQRRARGAERERLLDRAQIEIAQRQPFVTVATMDEISAVRTDRFTGWNRFRPSSPLTYVALERVDGERADRLRVTVTDARVTENLNPIAVEFRDRGTFIGLLYDPLARWIDGEVRPWLATDWEWERGDELAARVALRPGSRWHDGEYLTAGDVAFTYRFLQDTTMADGAAVPAPRFRGGTSLVESAEAVEDDTVRLTFGDTSPEVAKRALTAPVLPRHEWEDKTGEAELAGVEVNDQITEALVWTNADPVGSGPLQFERVTQEERLVLARYEDHFLHDDPPTELVDRVGGGIPYEQLQIQVLPSERAAVELLADGEADATAANTDFDVVPRIGDESSVGLIVDPSMSFYHVGFNTQREPLGNPHFRRTIAMLVDKERIAGDVFNGYADPTASPLAGTGWLASDLEWDGGDPEVPFAGEDGELDVAAVRERFRDDGFEYDEQDQLLYQQ